MGDSTVLSLYIISAGCPIEDIRVIKLYSISMWCPCDILKF